MADYRNTIIKKAGKGSCVVISGRNDYLTEAEKHLSDKKVYREVSNSENILAKLAEMSNNMFSSLKKKDYITEKQLKYFPYEHRKASGKLYFFSKGYIISVTTGYFELLYTYRKIFEIFRLSLETFNAEGVVVHKRFG